MDEVVKFLEDRVKYLDELIRMTPIEKSFTTQHRLVEAQFILYNMLEMRKKISGESNQHS